MRISSEHADLLFEPDHVRIVRLATARNAIHFHNAATDEFSVRHGEEFRIGLTTFRVYSVPDTEPAVSEVRDASARSRRTGTDPADAMSAEKAALTNNLAAVLDLIDRGSAVEPPAATGPPPETVGAAIGQASTTHAPAAFVQLTSIPESREQPPGVPEAVPAAAPPWATGQWDELKQLRAKLSSVEEALESESRARQAAEEEVSRAAKEARQRLAEEAQRREAAERIHQALEAELRQARAEAEDRELERAQRQAALSEASRLKEDLEKLQQELEDRAELHRQAESQINELVSEHERQESSELDRRQQDADKMRLAEETMARRAAEAERLRQEMEHLQGQLVEKMDEQRRAEDQVKRHAAEEQRWRQREEQLRQEVEEARLQAEREVERHRADAEAVKAELAMLRGQLEQSSVDQEQAEVFVKRLVAEERERALQAEARRESESLKRHEMEADAQQRRSEAEALAQQVATLSSRIQEQSEVQRQTEQRAGQIEQQWTQETEALREDLRRLQAQAEAKSAIASLAKEELERFAIAEQERLALERAERLAAQQAREAAEAEAAQRREDLLTLQRQLADLQAHWHRDSEAQRLAQEEAERWRSEAESLKENMKALEARVAETQAPPARVVPKRRSSIKEGEFDPYYRWLAIPPEDQPADHYRLLGLARFEDNLEIIESAADRQMEFVHRHHTGKHAHLSQRLLNELARARLCLRDPERKRQYDKKLWTELEAAQPPMVTSKQNAAMVSQSLDGTAFREYDLLDYVAETRHGHVFKALHRTLGRLVSMTVQSDAAAREPQLSLRFRLKSLVLARAVHPNLLRAFDAGHRENLQYVVTEFIDGSHLVELLKQRGALPIGEAVHYVSQAAAALHYLHERGIIHRNVKPSNMLLGSDGTMRLVGLGSSLYKRRSPLVDPALVDELEEPWPSGSLDYMAPEQSENSAMVGRRTDIYSLGCTLFTLLTRRLIFPFPDAETKNLAHREHPAPSLSVLRNEVPTELDAVYQRMVSKSPGERFDTMTAVLAALASCGFRGESAT